MMIKRGDTVRFLNDIGGGKVTRIVGKMVYVEDEDGFEIPSLINQVVLIEQQSDTKETTPLGKKELKESAQILSVKREDTDSKLLLALLKGNKTGSTSNDFRLYLINDSNFSILYSVSVQMVDVVSHLYHGQLEPNSKAQLDVFPVLFADNKVLLVQAILFKEDASYKIPQPLNAKVNLKSTQLMRPGAFVNNDYFNENAKLYQLHDSVYEAKVDELINSQSSLVEQKKERAAVPTQKSPKQSNGIVEVDLHIHELIDNYNGLSNTEMLNIQINKFHDILFENIKKKGQRIVFIHGVGNGVLKNEILKQLKTKYKGLYYQDASFKEYGFGATMVIV
jgi:hypothetical protein